MRVCILGDTHFVPVRNLVRHLVGSSVEVHLAGFGRLDLPPPAVSHPLPPSRLAVLTGRRRVGRLVESVRPDVVHAFYLTSYGFLCSRLEGVPVLATAMGSDVFGAPDLSPWLRPLREALVRRALSRADRIHSVAAHMTERLVALGADPARIVTFPRGVPVERFSDGTVRAEPDGPLRIVCNRKLEPVYDHATLLRAAALLRGGGLDFTLEIFGDGYLRPALESLAAELGLSGLVLFRGSAPYDDMPRILRNSQIFVTASLSDGTSSCLLEAMASGCIPVATAIPANLPWIESGRNGFLFPRRCPEGLATAVREAVADRDRWPEMQGRNRTLVRDQGSMEAGHARIVNIYRELAEERARRTTARR